MESIKEVLINRDGMSSNEADELIEEAKEAMNEALESGSICEAENVCAEFFGLEPDYLIELI